MSGKATRTKITALEQEIYALAAQLRELQKTVEGEAVKNYEFDTLDGKVTLRALFGEHNKLLVIHNMGQACRYCTLWGDGLNPFVAHLESTFAVVMLSKDTPPVQREFANSRGWRFRMASHAGGDYLREQIATDDYENAPGAVCYELKGDNIVRKSGSLFGPGDQFCALWHVLGLTGISLEDWTPQYNYWQRPRDLEDGGENLIAPAL